MDRARLRWRSGDFTTAAGHGERRNEEGQLHGAKRTGRAGGVVLSRAMRAVLQRVRTASVTVDGEVVGSIDGGLLVLVGAGHEDDEAAVAWLVDKCLKLRVFRDEDDRMNRSLLDVGGALLVVSQFTLLGDCRKGRRPSFAAAMEPVRAEALYEEFVARAREAGVEVATGRFGAMMDVALVNDGPVTLLLDTERRF